MTRLLLAAARAALAAGAAPAPARAATPGPEARAATESARTLGYGHRSRSDRIAVEPMRREADSPAIAAAIVIGGGGIEMVRQ